jgi:hypothetical protein
MGMGRRTRRVWRWILPRWQARHPRAQAVMSLERPRHTNLNEIIRREASLREASLPGWATLWKWSKMFFSEFEGNNWAKSASGNVSSQALSTCLAESQLKGCAAQQTLHFWATVLLGGHLFKIHWVCRQRGSNWSSGCLVWAGQKIGNDIFQTSKYKICTLNSEINAKWRCCLGEMGAETWETGGSWSVQSWNAWPLQKWQKCLVAAWAANNSQSKVE